VKLPPPASMPADTRARRMRALGLLTYRRSTCVRLPDVGRDSVPFDTVLSLNGSVPWWTCWTLSLCASYPGNKYHLFTDSAYRWFLSSKLDYCGALRSSRDPEMKPTRRVDRNCADCSGTPEFVSRGGDPQGDTRNPRRRAVNAGRPGAERARRHNSASAVNCFVRDDFAVQRRPTCVKEAHVIVA
jgi:hypothetical protein